MEKDIFILQLNKEELEGLQSALDATVKAHGIAVAAKCGALFAALQKAKPVPVPEDDRASVAPPVEPVEPVKLVKKHKRR